VSFVAAPEPRILNGSSTPLVSAIVDARMRELGGVSIRRILPFRGGRGVGPFVFFDHMGPTTFTAGNGVDVPPHPHIGLATLTYLLEGEIVHRDSLGSVQAIRPGDINWMIAGRGIAHSERTDPEMRQRPSRLHGLQLWVALPREAEEMTPMFHHHGADSLPRLEERGASIRVLAGSAYGVSAPVRTLSPLFYADVELPPGGELVVPGEYQERAVYVVHGAASCGDERATPGRMLLLAPGHDVSVFAKAPARLVLIGGAPLDGQRHIWWNFVSSSRERLEQAKRDWKAGRFAKVAGDEEDFTPLPA
jgi:redox-sensitive bicupin YhaK (pirin superfamily)